MESETVPNMYVTWPSAGVSNEMVLPNSLTGASARQKGPRIALDVAAPAAALVIIESTRLPKSAKCYKKRHVSESLITFQGLKHPTAEVFHYAGRLSFVQPSSNI